jgi:alpha-beta hydrolase superfamily lysophospholipase
MPLESFVDENSVEVFTSWWPVDAPSAVVVIAHGASEHALRYERFAGELNAAGIAVVAIDHRGHGRTGASTGVGLVGPGGGPALIADLHEVRLQAETQFPNVPLIVFGHSLGSLITLAYLVEHSRGLAGAVLCGFAADIDATDAMGELLSGFAELRDESAAAILAANNAPFEPARTPFDWLSRDAAEVDAYIADPYCGDNNPISFGYLIDVFDIVAPAVTELSKIECPVLVIAGDQDPAAGMGAFASGMADAVSAAGVRADLKLYEGARHELLNETNRDEVTAEVISWISTLAV